MMRLALSPEDKAPLAQARRTRPQIAERCHSILLNAEGWSVPHMARRLSRNEHTIRTWLKAYQASGLSGLQNTPQPGRPATKGQGVTAHLETLLVQSPSHFGSIEDGWTVAVIRHYLVQPTFKGSECPCRFFVLRALHTMQSRAPVRHRSAGDGIGHQRSARPLAHLAI